MIKRIYTKQLFNCSRCNDKNWLKQCGHCDKIIFERDKKGRILKFKKGHNNSKRGKTDTYKRYKETNGYWLLYIPSYFGSGVNDSVLEHVYFYQEKNKLCMLPWGVVHHIIPFKDGGSNLPWNLQGMMKGEHSRFHNKKCNEEKKRPPPRYRKKILQLICNRS